MNDRADRTEGEQTGGPEVKKGVAWVGRRLKQVEYTVVDEQAVVEGCIVLGEAEEVRQITEAVERAARTGEEIFGVAVNEPRYLWRAKTVPFDIHPMLERPERVREAIAHWVRNTPLRFPERDSGSQFLFPDWITFKPGRGCSSRVGCRGGQQFITVGDDCEVGNVIHEIGHAVGLFHEQSREDRDQFVEVRFDKVIPEFIHNFNQHIVDGTDFGAYDYASIMHYPGVSFSLDQSETIIPKKEGVTIGQRKGLSEGDIATIRMLYP
jgi:hypothetical protein